MIRIPKTMSTQHPDNVQQPFFTNSNILEGEDEIKEAFYVFSHLGCKEQLWDFEGKEVDNYVVKKLLNKYDNFFAKKKLGKDFFITLRLPNPDVEKNEVKILAETLESIPRSFDIAKVFYEDSDDDIAPIFEVAQPMTTNSISLKRIKAYYNKIVINKENSFLVDNDIKIREWIGEFNPKNINVIPLFEDMDGILNSSSITKEYLNDSMNKYIEYQRVWLARSDPALNYGSLSAVLMNKIALQRFAKLENDISIPIYPIFGSGSAPFRGNLRPDNVKMIVKAYPSVQTHTIQSAFKYDNPQNHVVDAVNEIEETVRKQPTPVSDEEATIALVKKISSEYQKQISLLSSIVNDFSVHIPVRRKRKLHIGLFGYSRSSNGIKLPRAITFVASMYSMGLPPEILGLNVLDRKDFDIIKDVVLYLDDSMADSLKYLNIDNLKYFPQEIQNVVLKSIKLFNYVPDENHNKITSVIMDDYSKRKLQPLHDNILLAASARGFLG